MIWETFVSIIICTSTIESADCIYLVAAPKWRCLIALRRKLVEVWEDAEAVFSISHNQFPDRDRARQSDNSTSFSTSFSTSSLNWSWVRRFSTERSGGWKQTMVDSVSISLTSAIVYGISGGLFFLLIFLLILIGLCNCNCDNYRSSRSLIIYTLSVSSPPSSIKIRETLFLLDFHRLPKGLVGEGVFLLILYIH